jgi:RNA polymerase sigma-70 factor, ECF subfamily
MAGSPRTTSAGRQTHRCLAVGVSLTSMAAVAPVDAGEATLLTAARSGDEAAFAALVAGHRRGLHLHCYRMLGSYHDAEEATQETLLRAWRRLTTFESRAPLRHWLYRIATTTCLNLLAARTRLPAAFAEVSHLTPYPDDLLDQLPADDADPATVAERRESVGLAFIAALQCLPATQRAVLILRDVLAWPTAEVAEVVGTTTAAVKSLLQRARARLEQVAPKADQVTEPSEPEARALLDQYIAAFENSDAAALERLLRQDATLELPPSSTWFAGGAAIARAVSALGSPGDWRMLPSAANGQPAAAVYHRSEGTYRAYAIVVLTATTRGIARIVVFGDLGLFAKFGLPRILPLE